MEEVGNKGGEPRTQAALGQQAQFEFIEAEGNVSTRHPAFDLGDLNLARSCTITGTNLKGSQK